MSPELASEWKARPNHAGHPFIADGIMDEIAWQSAPRRVLFLLKEAYELKTNSSGFDLRTLVREKWQGPKGAVWWRMGYWSYLLHRISRGKTPAFPSSKDDVRAALLSSAVVNIRKSGGKTRSSGATIQQYASQDSELLRRQIEDIHPDIIITGNVWNSAQIIWPEARKISDRFHLTAHGPLINFWHPASQIHNKLLYYSLAGIFHTADYIDSASIPAVRAWSA